MFSPFIGFLLILSSFSILSILPKKILNIAPFCDLSEKAFGPLPNFEFHTLSYFLLEAGTDKTLYASFISLIFSSAKLSPTFKSG